MSKVPNAGSFGHHSLNPKFHGNARDASLSSIADTHNNYLNKINPTVMLGRQNHSRIHSFDFFKKKLIPSDSNSRSSTEQQQ